MCWEAGRTETLCGRLLCHLDAGRRRGRDSLDTNGQAGDTIRMPAGVILLLSGGGNLQCPPIGRP
jgi:hypothetical protein